MPACPSWQTWCLTYQPIAESILIGSKNPLRAASSLTPRRHRLLNVRLASSTSSSPQAAIAEHSERQFAARKTKIANLGDNAYPRYARNHTNHVEISEFRKVYGDLNVPGRNTEKTIDLEGRVASIRESGSKLAFIDISDGSTAVQVLLNFNVLKQEQENFEKAALSECLRLLKRGDVISVRGKPTRSDRGVLSIKATALPTLLAPCLHEYPISNRNRAQIDDYQQEESERHVEILTSRSLVDTLVVRSVIIKSMRKFFTERGCLEVQTPILEATAGGAVARPFETKATEFENRKLNLRISPELWLKRLVIGGIDKVFEIGPSFRNEGLDKTHNPEFTTCEFYEAYLSLPELIFMTEQLLDTLWHELAMSALENKLPASALSSHFKLNQRSFQGPYRQLDFIPALNEALNATLPNLSSPDARDQLLHIFREQSIPLPATDASLPRLLDRLSVEFLEPQSLSEPAWIINIPECLSPLSKSFIHPTAPNAQPVAARAELFIHGQELVNCYEEENSPFEQRRKFIVQQENQQPSPAAPTPAYSPPAEAGRTKIDTSYLSALEWGLPPTGGWGLGVDRLVMLFTGRQRIEDVLTFGNLRKVTRDAERR